MRNLDFIFFDAGGGHRSAATALKQVIENQGRPWNVRLINLQELLDELDLFRKLTGIRLQDQYNRLLKNGWTWGAEYLIPTMQSIIRLYHTQQVKMLSRFWSNNTPDVVVSLIPHFNRALLQGLKSVRPRSELVTVITDLADFPPHFWLEEQDQYVVCGTERAVNQARERGYPAERILRTSGMIIQPRFYEPFEKDRRLERQRLGLDPDKTTGLVLFGGHGSPVMRTITTRLNRSGIDLQLILICGYSQKLAEALRGQATRFPKYVEGFTKEIPYYMRLADFFIGKPGPGSISEALATNLPVIVERNSFTLPQERYNTDWVQEKGVGLVVRNFNEIDTAVKRLLEPTAFSKFHANAAAMENRAVFEIPEMLERILEQTA